MKRFCLIVALFFAGCHAERDMMNSWNNAPIQRVILKWGPPITVVSDGSINGKIYIWQYLRYLGADPQGKPTNPYYHLREFYVNGNGVVYSWRTENKNVPAVNVYVHHDD
jgi:hypothetical protein